MWRIRCTKAGYQEDISVLKSLDINFKDKEKVALIGKNGSGKSTFVQMLLGTLPYFQFELTHNTNEYKTLDQVRSTIAVVFQYPDDQFIGSTVYEELYLNSVNHKVSELKIMELIEYFELNKLLYLEPHQLSGGEKQIIAFVTTLLSQPKILLLDESTSMLDPSSKAQFLKKILSYQEQHEMAVIHITHDLNELYLFDTIVYLKDGEVIFHGSYQTFMLQLHSIDAFHLPFELAVAQRLYLQGKIQWMPTNEVEWEEVLWQLQLLG